MMGLTNTGWGEGVRTEIPIIIIIIIRVLRQDGLDLALTVTAPSVKILSTRDAGVD